ncbi:trimeric intracellular cation channel family protein [bacterium 1XD21-13]|nr:trimeric intracellular cation channel family protein [bacterium 1XD21-13]
MDVGYSDLIIFIMEIIGTIAFASSGAMLAIRKDMDLFGVCVLGVITSVGGGVIRDLILGYTPPNMFRNPIYTMVALGVSVLLFLALYILPGGVRSSNCSMPEGQVHHSAIQEKLAAAYDKTMTLFDALGLGIFTVMGINTARTLGYDQTFLLIFVGVITGVGGGLMRDVIAQEKPYILTKHIYACASIAGALACVYSGDRIGNLASMTLGAAVVIVVRLLAMHYRWNLPRIH